MSNKAIIEKLKELNKLNEGLISEASVTLTMHGHRQYLNEFIRKRDSLKQEIASLETQDKEPSDDDILNAAIDYVDEEDNHFAKQAKKEAYMAGATHMRDNEIYIAPKG